MSKILKLILALLLTLLILISYLSLVGIETKKFNTQIVSKIKNINENLDIELKKIKINLDPFNLRANLKTINPKLEFKNKIIEIENIKSQISLKSLIQNKFAIENLEISTKSLELKNLVRFTNSINRKPELFILEKIIKKGYLIADIKLEFDDKGKIKENYEINGFIRDTKLSFFKKYNIEKLNFIFGYKKDVVKLGDIIFSLNDLNLLSEEIIVKKIKDDFLINGSFSHDKIELDKKKLEIFVKPFLTKLNVNKIKFSSKNIFSFKLNKKLRFKDLEVNSNIVLDELFLSNDLDLKKFFPKFTDGLSLNNNNLSIIYKKGDFLIKGKGNILSQNKNDYLTYQIEKKNDDLNFKTSLKITDNLLRLDFLNYQNKEKNETLVEIEGVKYKNNNLLIKSFNLSEKKNKMIIKNTLLNDKFQILNLDSIDLNYIDKDNQKNLIRLFKKKNEIFLQGKFFNVENLIDTLLKENQNSNFLKIDNKINVNIDNLRLDNENNLNNFSGSLLFNQKIISANLLGMFSKDKQLKLTIYTKGNNRITTLYMDRAEPIVKKYKFIKGFSEGILDFYSAKTFDESYSKIKIYDFKLKELPILTKILTLASLQGIADILSGEGIGFDEFEMNFKNKGSLMTIDEIYAIGPAISILMNGYVEKNKLVSLRGTLVPATTINKFIGSIPVLGKILVGSKTGEGVFGVSFKIKGSPKNLETSVNPIKTLTPRFITRTLEKIKKN